MPVLEAPTMEPEITSPEPMPEPISAPAPTPDESPLRRIMNHPRWGELPQIEKRKAIADLLPSQPGYDGLSGNEKKKLLNALQSDYPDVATGSDVMPLAGYQKFLGTPFKMGGDKCKDGIDCSSLTQQYYKSHNINLSRTANAQYYDSAGQKMSTDISKLQPGDQIFFKGTQDILPASYMSHTGIYIGNGKMLHASSKRGVITTSLQNYVNGDDNPDIAGVKRYPNVWQGATQPQQAPPVATTASGKPSSVPSTVSSVSSAQQNANILVLDLTQQAVNTALQYTPQTTGEQPAPAYMKPQPDQPAIADLTRTMLQPGDQSKPRWVVDKLISMTVSKREAYLKRFNFQDVTNRAILRQAFRESPAQNNRDLINQTIEKSPDFAGMTPLQIKSLGTAPAFQIGRKITANRKMQSMMEPPKLEGNSPIDYIGYGMSAIGLVFRSADALAGTVTGGEGTTFGENVFDSIANTDGAWQAAQESDNVAQRAVSTVFNAIQPSTVAAGGVVKWVAKVSPMVARAITAAFVAPIVKSAYDEARLGHYGAATGDAVVALLPILLHATVENLIKGGNGRQAKTVGNKLNEYLRQDPAAAKVYTDFIEKEASKGTQPTQAADVNASTEVNPPDAQPPVVPSGPKQGDMLVDNKGNRYVYRGSEQRGKHTIFDVAEGIDRTVTDGVFKRSLRSEPTPVAEPVSARPSAMPPVTEPVSTPVTEPVSTPVATPVTEPVPTPVSEPVPTPVSEPVATPKPPATTPVSGDVLIGKNGGRYTYINEKYGRQHVMTERDGGTSLSKEVFNEMFKKDDGSLSTHDSPHEIVGIAELNPGDKVGNFTFIRKGKHGFYVVEDRTRRRLVVNPEYLADQKIIRATPEPSLNTAKTTREGDAFYQKNGDETSPTGTRTHEEAVKSGKEWLEIEGNDVETLIRRSLAGEKLNDAERSAVQQIGIDRSLRRQALYDKLGTKAHKDPEYQAAIKSALEAHNASTLQFSDAGGTLNEANISGQAVSFDPNVTIDALNENRKKDGTKPLSNSQKTAIRQDAEKYRILDTLEAEVSTAELQRNTRAAMRDIRKSANTDRLAELAQRRKDIFAAIRNSEGPKNRQSGSAMMGPETFRLGGEMLRNLVESGMVSATEIVDHVFTEIGVEMGMTKSHVRDWLLGRNGPKGKEASKIDVKLSDMKKTLRLASAIEDLGKDKVVKPHVETFEPNTAEYKKLKNMYEIKKQVVALQKELAAARAAELPKSKASTAERKMLSDEAKSIQGEIDKLSSAKKALHAQEARKSVLEEQLAKAENEVNNGPAAASAKATPKPKPTSPAIKTLEVNLEATNALIKQAKESGKETLKLEAKVEKLKQRIADAQGRIDKGDYSTPAVAPKTLTVDPLLVTALKAKLKIVEKQVAAGRQAEAKIAKLTETLAEVQNKIKGIQDGTYTANPKASATVETNPEILALRENIRQARVKLREVTPKDWTAYNERLKAQTEAYQRQAATGQPFPKKPKAEYPPTTLELQALRDSAALEYMQTVHSTDHKTFADHIAEHFKLSAISGAASLNRIGGFGVAELGARAIESPVRGVINRIAPDLNNAAFTEGTLTVPQLLQVYNKYLKGNFLKEAMLAFLNKPGAVDRIAYKEAGIIPMSHRSWNPLAAWVRIHGVLKSPEKSIKFHNAQENITMGFERNGIDMADPANSAAAAAMAHGKALQGILSNENQFTKWWRNLITSFNKMGGGGNAIGAALKTENSVMTVPSNFVSRWGQNILGLIIAPVQRKVFVNRRALVDTAGWTTAQVEAWKTGKTRGIEPPKSLLDSEDRQNYFAWKTGGLLTPTQASFIKQMYVRGGTGAALTALVWTTNVFTGTGYYRKGEKNAIGEHPQDLAFLGMPIPHSLQHHDYWALINFILTLKNSLKDKEQDQMMDAFGKGVSAGFMGMMEAAPLASSLMGAAKTIDGQGDVTDNIGKHLGRWAGGAIPQLFQGMGKAADQENGLPRPVFQRGFKEVFKEKNPLTRQGLISKPIPFRHYSATSAPVMALNEAKIVPSQPTARYIPAELQSKWQDIRSETAYDLIKEKVSTAAWKTSTPAMKKEFLKEALKEGSGNANDIIKSLPLYKKLMPDPEAE